MEYRGIQADYRAYRVFEACRDIARGLSQTKPADLKPGDVFPSLRALDFTNDSPAGEDDDEALAMQSFQHLRRSFGA